ncbi:odorant receptor 63a-like [Sitodiplosis mosellana]|uniref:odorant receptor 63a-like n=1 Tax=Sitodiplosis mosellana TaxID=263140 RepID=UPI002444E6B3|nr:odorant receptor 63a-like [Sitodiplosis mosellana]
MAFCNNTIAVSSELIELELNEMSDEFEKKNESSEAKPVSQLQLILMRVLHMDEYVKSFGNMMYVRNFLSPPLFTSSIAVSIYSQYMMGYPAGYGFSVVSYVQMVILCYTGQNIQDRNDRLLKAFYNSKWYLLPKKDQKHILLMILRMENGVRVTIGPFQSLNYETLKILSQKIYSFLMFLINLGT